MRIYYVLIGACLVSTCTPAYGGSRLNLPQVSAEITLSPEEVRPIFEPHGGNEDRVLDGHFASYVIGSLPADLRNGCHDMVPDFGPAAAANTSWNWSVRLLHTEGDKEQSALLALRCTVHVPDITFYDERLAALSNGKTIVLKLLPLEKDCTNCADVYHLKFVQRFDADNGYFAELRVEHTTENPCCDGGDIESGERLLLIALPSGVSVLALDAEEYRYSNDDADGDTETRCKAAVTYERDSAAKLRALAAETSCTENGKFAPSSKVTRYRWDRAKGRFTEGP